MKLRRNNKYLKISVSDRFYWIDDLNDATNFNKKEIDFYLKIYKCEIA